MSIEISADSPAGAVPEIIRRDIRFGVAEVSDPAWFGGDPLLTAFCDALSLFFPEGERFFIRSVRAYAERVTDPALRRDIDAFCAQEAYHTREHEAYNRAFCAGGLDLDALEAPIKALLGQPMTPKTRLTVTVAIEHLTASFACMVLGDPSMFADAPRPYRDLWTWHALEEMEHKGVAFDVLKQVAADMPPWKRYTARCAVLLIATRQMHGLLLKNIGTILRARGHAPGLGTWLRLTWLLLGRPGHYRRVLGYYLRFFRPGFHPWHGDDGALADGWREYFNARAAKRGTADA